MIISCFLPKTFFQIGCILYPRCTDIVYSAIVCPSYNLTTTKTSHKNNTLSNNRVRLLTYIVKNICILFLLAHKMRYYFPP